MGPTRRKQVQIAAKQVQIAAKQVQIAAKQVQIAAEQVQIAAEQVQTAPGRGGEGQKQRKPSPRVVKRRRENLPLRRNTTI